MIDLLRYAGRLAEEAVMIRVGSTSQRVKTSAILPNSAIISGAKQWIGVAITPMHDRLQDAMLQVNPVAQSLGLPSAPESISLSHRDEEKSWIEHVPEGELNTNIKQSL